MHNTPHTHEGFPPSLTENEFNRLLHLGAIVDGRAGGAVLAQPGSAVRVVFKLGDQFITEGFIEPGSFVVNWEAAAKNLVRLRRMIAGETLREIVREEDPDGEVFEFILAGGEPHNKIVWLCWGQLVVPPEPTAKHSSELLDMNRATNPYRFCDLTEALGCMPGTQDGIV